VDANNKEEIDRLDKTEEWFARGVERKRSVHVVDHINVLYRLIHTKIFEFFTGLYIQAIAEQAQQWFFTLYIVPFPK
jgi:hypothetical protein